MKCIQCGGSGRIFFRPNKKRVPFIVCDVCKGTGECEGNDLWVLQGTLIQDWRIANGLTLREAARIYKIDASNLSKMERGLLRPDPKYVKVATSHQPE